MKFKAEMGHWSSVVGNSVHLIGEDGRFLGQIAIMCQDDRLREKDVQSELCEKICAALNADLCASGQQVRAALEGAVNWLDALLTLVQETSCDPDDPEAFDEVVMAAGMWLSSGRAALTPAPQSEGQVQRLSDAIRQACDLLAERSYGSPARSPAHNARLVLEAALAHATPTAQEAVPAAWMLRDMEGVICAFTTKHTDPVETNWTPLYAHPPRSSETVPVAWMKNIDGAKGLSFQSYDGWTPLYTHPPQPNMPTAQEVVQVNDDSLQARIMGVGNQIHNIGCEYQSNEFLAERLEDLRSELWGIAREMTQTVQEAVPVGWITQPYPGVKWSFSFHAPKTLPEGWIARPLYAHPPQPSETVAEAVAALEALPRSTYDCGTQWVRLEDARAALRALKGENK